jgi:hypothetical protein
VKAFALAFVAHRSADVRGLAGAIADGAHQNYGLLRDALMDAGEETMRFEVGQLYYVETLTKYYVGRVKSCDGGELVLDQAAWVSDTGLMTEFLRDGKNQHTEVEVLGDDFGIPVGMITAKAPWPHKPFLKAVRP